MLVLSYGCVRKFPEQRAHEYNAKEMTFFSRQPLKKKGDLEGGRGGYRAFVLRLVVFMFVV